MNQSVIVFTLENNIHITILPSLTIICGALFWWEVGETAKL